MKRFGDRENAFWMTSILYICYLCSLPSLGENFYWLAGGVTYQLGIVFLLLWLSLRSFFWGFLFVPLLVGMNEMLMILVLLVLVFRFFFSEEKKYKTICLLVLALCCCVTVVSAPGNELRLSYFSGNKSFFTTIWKSSAYLFRYLVEQLSHLELWGALFLLIPQLEKYHSKLNYRLMIVGGVAVLFLLFAPSFWSMNAPPPARAYALLCLVFFFFFFVHGACFLSQFFKFDHKKLGFFFFIVGFLASSNTQNVYYDSIKVLSYQAQYNNRLAILDGCSEVCYVDPIFPLPKALNFSDIESDSSSWKNVEYAHYFNKKAIVLKKP